MGILDFLGSGYNGGLLGGKSPYTDQMRYQAGMQGMGLLGSTLMAAGAPSTDPSHFGRTMMQGMGQVGPMMQQSLQSQLAMEDYMRQREQEEAAAAAWQDYLSQSEGTYSPEQMGLLSAMDPSMGMELAAGRVFAQNDPLTDSQLGEYITQDGRLVTMLHGEAIAQGLQPWIGSDAWFKQQIELRAAGSPSVTVESPEVRFENSDPFIEGLSKNDADYVTSLDEKAASARQTLDTVANLRQVPLETGRFVEAQAALSGALRAVGLGDLAEDILDVDPADVESYASFANGLALAQKDSTLGGGILSDSDIKVLYSLSAQPENQPRANQIILGALERAAQMQLAEYEAADEWASTYGGLRNKGDGSIEGDEGLTFRQFWSKRRSDLAEEMRSENIVNGDGGSDGGTGGGGSGRVIDFNDLPD